MIGMLPGWYLRYYYCPEKTLRMDRRSVHSEGELDQIAEEELTQVFIADGYSPAARRILKSKGGAQYYLPVLQVMAAMVNDTNALVIADVRNNGAIRELADEVCVEVPTRIGREGVEAQLVGAIPQEVRGLLQTVKAYEELTIEAAMRGDRGLAIAALMANPLVGTYAKARTVFERALENEGMLLPQFNRQ